MRQKKGITIIEIILVLSILLITLAAGLEVFTIFTRNFKVVMLYLNAYLKGREAIDFISKDCRIAIRVMDGYAGYTSSTNSLVLKVPSLDASGNILDINNEFDYIIYRIKDQDLWKTVIPGAASSRPAFDGVFKKTMESIYIESQGTPLSDILHKSTITCLTLRAAIAESLAGDEYRITPGTTIKLMNYEWEFVR